MRLLAILSFITLSLPALADSYLCVSEAGAGVEHGGANGISAEVYDVSDIKFVISDEQGKWMFKVLGKDQSALVCDSESFCEIKGGIFGTMFIKFENGVFLYINPVSSGETRARHILYTLKGRCSKL